jgi:hypothetical protein
MPSPIISMPAASATRFVAISVVIGTSLSIAAITCKSDSDCDNTFSAAAVASRVAVRIERSFDYAFRIVGPGTA